MSPSGMLSQTPTLISIRPVGLSTATHAPSTMPARAAVVGLTKRIGSGLRLRSSGMWRPPIASGTDDRATIAALGVHVTTHGSQNALQPDRRGAVALHVGDRRPREDGAARGRVHPRSLADLVGVAARDLDDPFDRVRIDAGLQFIESAQSSPRPASPTTCFIPKQAAQQPNLRGRIASPRMLLNNSRR